MGVSVPEDATTCVVNVELKLPLPWSIRKHEGHIEDSPPVLRVYFRPHAASSGINFSAVESSGYGIDIKVRLFCNYMHGNQTINIGNWLIRFRHWRSTFGMDVVIRFLIVRGYKFSMHRDIMFIMSLLGAFIITRPHTNWGSILLSCDHCLKIIQKKPQWADFQITADRQSLQIQNALLPKSPNKVFDVVTTVIEVACTRDFPSADLSSANIEIFVKPCQYPFTITSRRPLFQFCTVCKVLLNCIVVPCKSGLILSIFGYAKKMLSS